MLTPHCINIRHAGLQYQHSAGAHCTLQHRATVPGSPHAAADRDPMVSCRCAARCQEEVGTSTWHQPGHNSSASRLQTNTNISTFCHRLRTLGHIFQQYINLSSTPQYYCHKEEFLPYHNDGLLRQGFRIKFLLHVSQLRVSTIAHLIVTQFLLPAACWLLVTALP